MTDITSIPITKRTRIRVGSRVQHDFSKTIGKVVAIKRRPQRYNYQVAFYDDSSMPTIVGWYRREYLVPLTNHKEEQ